MTVGIARGEEAAEPGAEPRLPRERDGDEGAADEDRGEGLRTTNLNE
jgi:hypothetical protein